MSSIRHLLWLLVLCVTIIGCGSPGPFEYVPVNGKISYDDGAPLPSGFRLVFIAQDAAPIDGAFPRAAEAFIDSQGQFDCVTSYKYCDGLIPGEHKVVVQPDRAKPGKPIVPEEYTNSETTPLVVDTADSPFEIKVPNP